MKITAILAFSLLFWHIGCTRGSSRTTSAPGEECPAGPEYQYKSKDSVRCAVLPVCDQGVPFRNPCGCGCRLEKGSADLGYTACTEAQRRVDFCIEEYAPACGWFTTSPGLCSGRLCRETFANSCFACRDRRVRVFTKGGCRD